MSRPVPHLDPRRLVALVALVFAVTSAATLMAPSPTYAWAANTFSSASEKQLVALHNQARAAAGLKSLRIDAALTAIARGRSKDMIVRDYFSHDIPGSGNVFGIMKARGYCFRSAGENIGYNYESPTPPRPPRSSRRSWAPAATARTSSARTTTRSGWRVSGGQRQEDVDRGLRRQVRIHVAAQGDPAPTPRPTAKPRPTQNTTARATPRTPEADPQGDAEADPRPEPAVVPSPSRERVARRRGHTVADRDPDRLGAGGVPDA